MKKEKFKIILKKHITIKMKKIRRLSKLKCNEEDYGTFIKKKIRKIVYYQLIKINFLYRFASKSNKSIYVPKERFNPDKSTSMSD